MQKLLAFTDAMFAPNESIRCKNPISYAQIDNDIYMADVNNTKLTFVVKYIAKPFGLKVGTSADYKIAKRILINSVIHN